MKFVTDLLEKGMPADMRKLGSSVLQSTIEQSRVGLFLRRHAGTLARSIAVAALLGVLYLLLAKPVYMAQTQILIDPGLPNVLRDQTIEPAMAMDSQQVETEIAVLRSEEVANAVIDRLKLGETSSRGTSIYDILPSWIVSPRDRAQENARRTLEKFESNLTVRRIGVSYGINAFYTSDDPNKAAEVANVVADEYIKFQVRARAEAAKTGSEWLEQRLADLRTAMNAAARRMQEVRARQDYSIGRGGADRAGPRGPAAAQEPAGDAKVGADQAAAAAAEARLSLEDLESTANTYRRIYENYLQSYMAAVQRQSFPIANARVITKATPPLNQSRSRGLILVMSVLLGALVGAAIGFVRDAFAKQQGAAGA